MADEKPWSTLKSEIYSFVGRNPRSNKRLVRFARLQPTDRILDIGCGPGAAVRRAARIAVAGTATGVDPSAAMVSIARRRSKGVPNTRFEQGSAERIPCEDDAFTHVWSIHAFHHWNDAPAGLTECFRVLAPEGTVFITETRGSGGHSMSAGKAREVTDLMERLGFIETRVERLFREYVVVGTKPG